VVLGARLLPPCTFQAANVALTHLFVIAQGSRAGSDLRSQACNISGTVGDGTTTTRTDPTPVSGGLRFSAVSAGERHTCGLVADGAVYCWGENGAGQLGDGTLVTRLTPVRVVQQRRLCGAAATEDTPASTRDGPDEAGS
jgi:alpha-tubulin suppressor-like RCC1 family protein